MATKSRREFFTAMFFAVLALCYFIGALCIRQYNAFSSNSVNSQTIPKLFGVLLFFLSCIQMYVAFSSERKSKALEASNSESSNDDSSIIDTMDLRSILLTILYLCIYTVLLPYVGFIIMTILFLTFEITLLTKKEARKKALKWIISISFVFSVAVYYVFTDFFQLILPSGIMG